MSGEIRGKLNRIFSPEVNYSSFYCCLLQPFKMAEITACMFQRLHFLPIVMMIIFLGICIVTEKYSHRKDTVTNELNTNVGKRDLKSFDTSGKMESNKAVDISSEFEGENHNTDLILINTEM